MLGGGAAVLLSFLLIVPRAAASIPAAGESDAPPLPPANRWLAALGLVLLAGLVAAGLLGTQEVAENILPTVFWLVLWIAVPLSCGVLGDWTRSLNPFASIARLADSDGARRALLGDAARVAWPRWLGWWPAAVTFFVVACGELVYNLTATRPDVTASGLLVGAGLAGVMGLLFGAEAWVARGEVFSVLFSTWGRLGWSRFGAPGRPGFGGGLDVPVDPAPSRLVFLLLLLVSVSFDGLISTSAWKHVHHDFEEWTDGSVAGIEALTVLAFAALAGALFAVFGLFAVAVASYGGNAHGVSRSLADLLPSLLPIAFGYLLAHNLQYLAVNGQLLIPLIGNPVGLDGWQWAPAPFNDDYQLDTKIVPSSVHWYIAVAVIVVVHAVAVLVAHRHLTRSATSPECARRSEYPWLVAMVGYTMISLWLLAQPLVEESGHAEHEARSPVSSRF